MLKLFWLNIYALFYLAYAQYPSICISNLPNNNINTLSQLVMDKNNNAYVVWQSIYPKAGSPDGVVGDLFYSKVENENVSTPRMIEVTDGYYSKDFSIDIDATDVIHIVFRRSLKQIALQPEDDLYYVTINNNGLISSPIKIVDGRKETPNHYFVDAPHNPKIACSSNVINIVFTSSTFIPKPVQGQSPPMAIPQGNLILLKNEADSWKEPVVLYGKPVFPVENQHLPVIEHEIKIDKNKKLHTVFLTWTKDNLLIHGILDTTLKIDTIARVSGRPELSFDFDSKNNMHILYCDPDVKYVNNAQSVYSNPISLGKLSYRPYMIIDKVDKIHVAFKQNNAISGLSDLIYGFYNNSIFNVFPIHSGIAATWFINDKFLSVDNNGIAYLSIYDCKKGVSDCATYKDIYLFKVSNIAEINKIKETCLFSSIIAGSYLIRYTLSSSTNVLFNLYNIMGQRVWCYEKNMQNVGCYTVQVNRKLPFGNYPFYFRAGDKAEYRGILSLR
jgi:hypothetical protein